MKVYLVERISNGGYDTFDSFVVVAESPTQALNTMPSIDDLKVTLISNTSCFKEWKIICISFNAG